MSFLSIFHIGRSCVNYTTHDDRFSHMRPQCTRKAFIKSKPLNGGNNLVKRVKVRQVHQTLALADDVCLKTNSTNWYSTIYWMRRRAYTDFRHTRDWLDNKRKTVSERAIIAYRRLEEHPSEQHNRKCFLIGANVLCETFKNAWMDVRIMAKQSIHYSCVCLVNVHSIQLINERC